MPELNPMKSQNGLFGQYLGNGKRYDLKTLLYPLNVAILRFRDIAILKFGPTGPKKGFPKVDFGRPSVGASMTHKLPKKVPRTFYTI